MSHLPQFCPPTRTVNCTCCFKLLLHGPSDAGLVMVTLTRPITHGNLAHATTTPMSQPVSSLACRGDRSVTLRISADLEIFARPPVIHAPSAAASPWVSFLIPPRRHPGASLSNGAYHQDLTRTRFDCGRSGLARDGHGVAVFHAI